MILMAIRTLSTETVRHGHRGSSMRGNVKAALVFFVVVGAILLGLRFAMPFYAEWKLRHASDAKATKGTITVAVDNWIGYFPLCSPEMKKAMRSSGWNFRCEDDEADYPKRMKRLKDKDIRFAVATVDSFILNGAPVNFPGVIPMVIDQSKGGDSILARKDCVANLNALKGRVDIKVALTPNSPSHHFAKVAASHFGIPELLPPKDRTGRLVETNGSKEALKKLLSGEVCVAILWEPDVSRALADKNIIKLLGTEDTERVIVDILLVDPDYADKNSETVMILLSHYFTVLKFYRDNNDLLVKEIISETKDADGKKFTEEAVRAMLKGVEWATLADNAQKWFGIAAPGGKADDGLYATIDSTVRILRNNKDFARDPIPDGDPSRLTRSQFIRELSAKAATGFIIPSKGEVATGASLGAKFAPLNDSGWKALREVGALKIEPITFRSGTADLTIAGKTEIDQAVESLKHYPKFRILIKGHTGMVGDPAENKVLSQERADSIARYIMATYGIDEHRLRPVGLGSSEPLARLPEEQCSETRCERAYNYRLPRVEILLVAEVY